MAAAAQPAGGGAGGKGRTAGTARRGGEQGYTAGRNYMFLAVTICAWP